MFRFPWGDFHSLNLGWFLQKFNELREDWATAEAGIDGALDAEIQKAEDALTDVFAARDAAAASATAAGQSATAAGNSATQAGNSATQAGNSASAAADSATAAGQSETAAGNSATAASNSAGAAATSATAAGNSATAAAGSATQAGNSATAAGNSASAAAESASAAAESASAAREVEQSIPADYSTLSNDVSVLKAATDNKSVFFVAGVIRNEGEGWEIINDGDHEPLNISAIRQTTQAIVLTLSETASKVLAIVVNPDEVFAKDYSVGTSVGFGTVTIVIYRNEHAVGGLLTFRNGAFNYTAYSTGILNAEWIAESNLARIYHEPITNVNSRQRWLINVTSFDGKATPRIITQTTDYDDISFYDASGNRITSPSAAIDFIYERIYPATLVDPATVISSTGNFWINGLGEL